MTCRMPCRCRPPCHAWEGEGGPEDCEDEDYVRALERHAEERAAEAETPSEEAA